MALTRRDLLLGTAGLAGASALLPRAFAGSPSGTNLIVVTALGGWDTSYALDPKLTSSRVEGPEVDEDATIADDREAVTTFGGLDVVTNEVKRPAVSAFFERWHARTSLVRGVWVGSVAHEECRLRVLTGATSETRPDLGAIAAYGLGPDSPVPYMDLGGAAYTGELAAYSGRTGQRNQLRMLLDRRAAFQGPPPERLRYPLYTPATPDRAPIDAWLDARAEAWRARAAGWGQGAHRVDDWFTARAKAVALQSGGTAFVQALAATDTRTLASQVDLSLEVLQSGLSRAVLIDTGGAWDTHQDNIDQHALHDQLFVALDRLVTGLQDASLLDQTAIVVLSEMSRTPRRNDKRGKDHWPVTTSMLIGGPFAGGRVWGGTDDGMDALGVDLATGELSPSLDPLRYDNLAAGILAALDVDPGDWFRGVTPLGGLGG